MLRSIVDQRSRGFIVAGAITLVVTACSGAATTPPSGAAIPPVPSASVSAQASPSNGTIPPATSPPSPSASEPPDTGGGTTSGDVPDNAVFLRYHGANPGFTIQYVEGWQVTQQSDGVVIRDKDSSETVRIVARPSDVTAYVGSTDLPALQGQAGFKLVKQDSVAVGAAHYVHLVYHLPAPPDPVTGKQVPSTVDRYYVPGPNGLAIVSLSTPDGVDNVDAFRQMIGSFRWS